jgi:voltage-gated potassium channel
VWDDPDCDIHALMSKPLTQPQAAASAGAGVRERLNTALFELGTPLGRCTNVGIMVLVVVSVVLGMVGTLAGLPRDARLTIEACELAVSVLFAIEYCLRLYAARYPWRYALSFHGLVDLLTWLPILLLGQGSVALRLLRIVRLLKLLRFMGALRLFLRSMNDTLDLVMVVVGTVSVLAIIAGNLVWLIEPETFPNAFTGTWWALVTMTTVGYGDLVPKSGIGMVVAAALMLTGITMFAILTGTVSVKVASLLAQDATCGACEREIRARYAFCPHCGSEQTGEK